MPFEQTIRPQFRDADPDGLIGLRGAMRYFQDAHTWFMHNIDKGNDVIPGRYGAAWVYTRYVITLERRLDYTDMAQAAVWLEPYRLPVLVNVDYLLRQHGKIAARGRLENCVFSLEHQRPLRLGAIEFPDDAVEDVDADIPAFINLERSADGMAELYRRTVRVSDLDNSAHMTNLRYIEMFQDAYDWRFWREYAPNTMQLSFLSQCREGETLSVRAAQRPDGIHMAAVHDDEKLAAIALFARRG